MGKLVLDDVTFRLSIEEVTGVIRAEQGIPMFYSENSGVVAPIPCFISSDYYDTEVSAYIYSRTNQILLEPQHDDVLAEELADDEIAVNESYEEVQALMEEQKLRLVPKALMFSAISALGIILAIIEGALVFLFKVISFSLPLLLVLIPIIAGSFGVWYYGKILDQTRVYDCEGNWIDLATGETNLDGGYQLPSDI